MWHPSSIKSESLGWSSKYFFKDIPRLLPRAVKARNYSLYLFIFGITPGDAQGLLGSLHSEITHIRALGTIWMPDIEPRNHSLTGIFRDYQRRGQRCGFNYSKWLKTKCLKLLFSLPLPYLQESLILTSYLGDRSQNLIYF